MVYLDPSCFLRILRNEPKGAEVRRCIAAGEIVIVSSLAELEVEINLRGDLLGGSIRQSQWRQYHAQIAGLRNVDPFRFRHLPAAVFTTTLRQNRHPPSIYCRPLDRLHLAAMEELTFADS